MSRRACVLIITAVLGLVALWSPSSALTAVADDTPSSWRITNYDLDATAARNGALDITVDFTFDFANDKGHGPYVAIPKRQAIEGDDDHWRAFTIDNLQVSSPSGAPTDVKTETEGGVWLIRIGRENVELTGPQQYHLSYRLTGIVNPDVAASGLDEINWNVIGPKWEVPINDVDVRLQAPAPAERVACFTGKRFDQPCSTEAAAGDTSTFHTDALAADTPMQIVAGYPVGTFVGAEPMLIKRHTIGNVLPLTPLSGSLAGAVLVGGIAGLALAMRRVGRDRQYVGAAYGYGPGGDGTAEPRTVAATRQPVAVQFTPPADARPGELGTLTDERADTHDVTATLVDLAVRGYLRIEEIPEAEQEKGLLGRTEDKSRWRLVQLAPPDGLMAYEKTLYDGIFAKSSDPVLGDLAKTGEFAKAVEATKTELHSHVAKGRHWFRFDPSWARGIWASIGVLIILAGAGLALLLGLTAGLGLIGVAVAAVGLGFFVTMGAAPARTADGVAMLQQALGFQLYLRTAEAEQIRFEEGEDIFSRYLPYAIAWKCADRWASVFAELARQGHDIPTPGWYVGTNAYLFASTGGASFTDSLTGFTEAATSTMTAATSGSGGGSGFSGGGGVGGGGGGGW